MKKTVVCGVQIIRNYECRVRVDTDASDDEIRRIAIDKILDCGDSALVENSFAGIDSSDIHSVEPSYEVDDDDGYYDDDDDDYYVDYYCDEEEEE